MFLKVLTHYIQGMRLISIHWYKSQAYLLNYFLLVERKIWIYFSKFISIWWVPDQEHTSMIFAWYGHGRGDRFILNLKRSDQTLTNARSRFLLGILPHTFSKIDRNAVFGGSNLSFLKNLTWLSILGPNFVFSSKILFRNT